MSNGIRFGVSAVAALSLAACSAGPACVGTVPTQPAASANDVDAAFDLLMQGDENGARNSPLPAVLDDGSGRTE